MINIMYSEVQKVSVMLFIFLKLSIVLIGLWIKNDLEKSKKEQNEQNEQKDQKDQKIYDFEDTEL